MTNTYYMVLQGMFSPRDNTIGWRVYDEYATKEAAIRVAKGISISQVLECTVVFHKEPKEKSTVEYQQKNGK